MAGCEESCVNESKSEEAPGDVKKVHEIRFIVVIRGRNCEKYIKKCLQSFQKQVYQNWQAMIVLDAPTDNSVHVTRELCDTDKRFNMYVNEKRRGLCGNMFFAIKWANCLLTPDDDTVFAILDADDWLSHTALDKVARVFRKHPDTLITHGSYIKLSIGRKTKVSRPYPKHGNVRKLPWRASHLKTIKWGVLKNIQDDWFQHKGKWLDAASDLALMFPCIEIAGLKRVRHISKPIYYWRDNVTKAKRIVEIKCEKILRNKKAVA